ncbi:hypothetical protein [Kiloniella majae]|uniref:hypothetical protein n=1 Tax=Kiloniella majae TaxID=1938558 RepID=UPI000A276D78|nr:hypothetical protein [Kiloniella majae]
MLLDMLILLDAFFYWAIYVVACLFLGVRLVSLLGLKEIAITQVSAAGYLGLSFAMGLLALGSVFEVIAALGLFSKGLVGGLILVGMLSGVPIALRAIPLMKEKMITLSSQWSDQPSAIQIIIAVTVLLILILACITLSPPSWDAMAYYLAQPKLIAATGRFTLLPAYEDFSQIGLAGEMHFAVFYLFSSEFAAKMVVWAAMLSSVALLWAIGSLAGLGRLGQWVLIALLLTSTVFTNIAWDGKSDLFATAWGLGAVYAVLLVEKFPNRTSFSLSGLLAGGAMAGKLSFILTLIPLLGILFIWRVWLCAPRTTSSLAFAAPLIRKILIASGWAIIAILPLIIKNAAVYDQPFAPIYLFGSENSGLLNQGWFTPENTRWILMTYPLALVFGQYPMQYGNLSALWLALLPLLFFAPRPVSFIRSPLFVLSVVSVLTILLWAILRPAAFAPRYFIIPLLTILPAVAYSAEVFIRTTQLRLLKAIVLLAIAFSVFSASVRFAPAMERSISYLRQTAHKSWGNPIWAMTEYVAREGRPGERIFLMMYYRSMLRNDLLQCVLTQQESVTIREANSSHDIWEKMHMAGSNYLILDKRTHASAFSTDLNIADTPEWLTVEKKAYPGDKFVLYILKPSEAAPEPKSKCIEGQNGVWTSITE